MTEDTTAANNDEWVYNVAGERPSPHALSGAQGTICETSATGGFPTVARILAVRISLVARTSASNVGARTGQPPLEDHVAAASLSPDRVYRVKLQTTVALRNPPQ
jgi:hypothetical protein